ncbi:MAG TPA: PDZ domain-containing protein [Pyrinomonadaceae bacterium]|nr:PDZ domain-containing protein [Pyrinomonadaceae bacterium]
MFFRMIKLAATIVALALCGSLTMAQTPAPSPKKPAPQVHVTQGRPAPQVVTIVHRLSGLKMFRSLLRSQQQVQVTSLESGFNLTDDVHTNVIAGLAMDDGETIAAWLPEANLEFAPPGFPASFGESQYPDFKFRLSEPPPDVSVIGPDGKQLAAKYVGFDATTGLSILRLDEKNSIPFGTAKDEPVVVGENVLLFGPEPVANPQSLLDNNLYVRIGSIEGQIQKLLPAPTGEVTRLRVIAPRLSQANIGGIALNEAGETIGIVDGLLGNSATVLPTASIRRAAQRVLERRSSVPRPWLGVKGEAVAALQLNQFVVHGWAADRAAVLAGEHRGILLTSIVPGSPAAQAALRAGDVILKVDDKEIQNADDFTFWLDQAGPSTSVLFTVARPDRPAAEPLNVKLSGILDPAAGFGFRNSFPLAKGLSLIEQGAETITLRPAVALQLGTTAGLLVVYVEPATPAAEAGLQPGDVIQSIDGKPISALNRATALKPPMTLQVMRAKQKLTIKLSPPTRN